MQSQSAKDALKLYSQSYAQYLEDSALAYASKFPEQADYFMQRTLSEALAGNEGN